LKQLALPHFRDDNEEKATTAKKPKTIERIVDDSMRITKNKVPTFSKLLLYLCRLQ
jgi:hypothetical protein